MWTVQDSDLLQRNHIQKILLLLEVMPNLMVGKVRVRRNQMIGIPGIHLNLVTRLTW